MAPTKVYWRSNTIPLGAHFVLIVTSILFLVLSERMTREENREHYGEMLEAAQTMSRGLAVLRRERLRLAEVAPIDVEVDPLRTGVIGLVQSKVTTLAGHLPAKQASVNPNWAAVAVDLLREAGVRQGDVVAVAVSGSFPAINLAVYCAIEVMGAKPVVIASASASQFGANVPGLLWLDMERALVEAEVIAHRAVAASLGGEEDRAVGMEVDGVRVLREAVEVSGATFLEPKNYDEAVNQRIAIYEQHAGTDNVVCMINVGGGTATTGPPGIDRYFESGLIHSAQPRAFAIDSVIGYFLKRNTPVINFSGVNVLARQHGLPYPPIEEPILGAGGVYRAVTYRRGVAGGLALALIGLVWLITRASNLGALFSRPKADARRVEPMA